MWGKLELTRGGEIGRVRMIANTTKITSTQGGSWVQLDQGQSFLESQGYNILEWLMGTQEIIKKYYQDARRSQFLRKVWYFDSLVLVC